MDQEETATVTIDKDLLKKLFLGAMSLKNYIEQAPVANPVLWMVDRKTPVMTLPDFKYATEALMEIDKSYYSNSIFTSSM